MTDFSGLLDNLLVHTIQGDFIRAMACDTEASVTACGGLRAALILLFSSAWLITLIAGWIFPRFGGSENAGAKTIDRIRWSTGTWQQWDMFRTIPYLRSYQMELVGGTSDGERKTFGAVLPDFEDFDGPNAIRYHYSFLRIFHGNEEFSDGYVTQAAKALRGRNPEVERFSIRLLSQPTRSLHRSREDGELWTTVTEQLGPFSTSDD